MPSSPRHLTWYQKPRKLIRNSPAPEYARAVLAPPELAPLTSEAVPST